MRIGIDARELRGRSTGAGRYLGGLLQSWAHSEAAACHEILLYSPEPLAVPFDAARFSTRIVPGRSGTWWEQVHLARAVRADRPDVFFAPAYTAPLRVGLPTVVAIHDVSFATHPEWFRMREGVRRRFVTRRSAAQASAVITISEFSRREIVAALRVPGERVHVIPPGVNAPPQPAAPALGEDRVLFVGSIFNRRHVPDLIRAFALLARRRHLVTLDIVGDNRSYPHQDVTGVIASEGLVGRVRWHKYASEDQLREFYHRARAFAFLSEYEGLGLTPLEALAARVPPVLLDTPVAHESCGEAALYVSLDDAKTTAQALELALFDVPTRNRILSAAPATLARYSWTRAATETLALIERCGTR